MASRLPGYQVCCSDAHDIHNCVSTSVRRSRPVETRVHRLLVSHEARLSSLRVLASTKNTGTFYELNV